MKWAKEWIHEWLLVLIAGPAGISHSLKSYYVIGSQKWSWMLIISWFCRSYTEVRQLESQSSEYPCGFRTEGSCKSNDWSQTPTNPHCYRDSTGELQTPQAASLWKPRSLFILKQKMSVDQYGFRLRKTGSDFVVEATLKSWTETPKPTPQLLPQGKVCMLSTQRTQDNGN